MVEVRAFGTHRPDMLTSSPQLKLGDSLPHGKGFLKGLVPRLPKCRFGGSRVPAGAYRQSGG